MTPAARVRPVSLQKAIPGWLVLLCLALWLAALAWARWLTLPDEGRYAGVAWEMLRSRSPMVPLLDGMPYFHKPPLYYWLAQLSYALFGVHEFSARVPSLIGAWSAGAGLYAFVSRYRNVAQARWAVAILGLMPLFFGAAQFANMDMLVASMITLCVLAAADTALRREAGRPFRAMSIATGVLAALAVLAKGLIGLALPGAIVLAWLLLRRDWRGMRALLWVPALLAFALVAVPWFWLMQAKFPGFYHYFFVYQHFERFAQSGFNNAQPFWFYVPIVVGLSLPWSIWGASLFTPGFWREADPHGLRRLMAIWIAVVMVFFSIPQSKLIGYVLAGVSAAGAVGQRAPCTGLGGGQAPVGGHRGGCGGRHLPGGDHCRFDQSAGQRGPDHAGAAARNAAAGWADRPACAAVRPGLLYPGRAARLDRRQLARPRNPHARQLAQGTVRCGAV